MDSLALRPRKATEIVDAAVEVYRRNPVHFILLTAVVHVPWLILQILFISGEPTMDDLVPSVLIGLGTFVSYMVISGLIIHMASELYLGRPADALSTLRQVGGKLPAIFIASIVQTLAIMVSLLFFLFPALWTSAVLFAVLPAIAIEKKGLSGAFDRSKSLSEGLKIHILCGLGLVILIRIVVQIGVGMIVLFLIKWAPLKFVVGAIASVIIYPIVGIVDALLYYDARIRREGFDIEMMAAKSESTPVAV